MACDHGTQHVSLPDFIQIQEPNFTWGMTDGCAFVKVVDDAYAQVAHWRRNLFLIPSGKAGKEFIREITCLFNAYADASSLECIALKSIAVMQVLLLQKPIAKSKS